MANASTQIRAPRLRRWNKDEYYQLLDLGMFDGQRVELIDGEIIQMPAQKNEHFIAITLTAEALEVAFGEGYWARPQGTLDLSPTFVPDPDVAVVFGRPRGGPKENPPSALLVVEVSDTTLSHDR